VALSLADLRGIDTVVAVASEAEKPLAILGVLRAGAVDVLVVDEGNARTILDLADDGRIEEPALPARQPAPQRG
jgi:DNA-binding transcriptional regulator LsrR (DeoR family)